MSDRTFGQYESLELLGAGGMGEVYLATDPTLQRKVALKFPSDELMADDEARERLLREARAASALNHPHICTIYEVGEKDGRWYISMEYVEGRPLNEIIARGPLPAERIESYGVQIADAVAHAHERGVIHQDLKSANIMVTPEGRAKVLDFGLAVHEGIEAEAATQSRVTSAEPGTVSGTLPYMAPERLRGQPADQRVDVWALGVILYEMAAGHLPFHGETAFELTSSILKDSVTLPQEVPSGLRATIQRCLAKSPGERYQSAAEVRAALEAVQSATGEAEVIAAPEPARSGWFTRAWAGAVVVVVILGLWWGLWGRGGAGSGTEGIAVGASGRPTLAVLSFQDHTGNEQDAWLASGVPSMLQTGLAQTTGLDVVSNRRIYEIMRQLGEEELEELDLATLGEIARRSGAGAVVAGAIYATGTDYRIDVQVEDVNTGRVIAAHTATGPDVFTLVDDLTARVRDGLELEPSQEKSSIAEITTDSLEAWRFYSEGMEAARNLRGVDARNAFLRAVELDPAFAMAYYRLSELTLWLEDPNAADEYEMKVLEHLDRLPKRQRLAVVADFAYQRDGNPKRAAELYEEFLTLYPNDEDAYTGLSILYAGPLRDLDQSLEILERGVQAVPASGPLWNQYGYGLLEVGRYVEALRAIEKYAELNPDEPNPTDSLAEMYLRTGQPEKALEKYTEALAIDSTWIVAHVGRTMAYAMLGRYDEALAEFGRVVDLAAELGLTNMGGGPAGAILLAKVGRLQEALQRLDENEEIATKAGVAVLFAVPDLMRGGFAIETGDYGRAADLGISALGLVPDEGNQLWQRQQRIASQALIGLAAARSGDTATAREQLEWLSEICDLQVTAEKWTLETLRGEIALVEQDLDQAEVAFRAAEPDLKMDYSASVFLRSWLRNSDPLRDGVARTLRARGNLAGAAAVYRRLLTPDMSSKYTSMLEPRYVLELARLLDETGDTEAARVEYERFAELWKDADPELQPLVEEARQRATALGG